MKYLAAFLLLGLASATTIRKNFTVYGVPPAGQQYYSYYQPAAYYAQIQGLHAYAAPIPGSQQYAQQQQRPAGRPLQIRDVYDKPVLVLVNDSSSPGKLKGCVLAEGLVALPTNNCTRDVYWQLLQTPEDQHALLFDPYNADIERFYRFRNYTVSRFELPKHTKVAYLAHTLATGLPSLLICQDKYCAENVRKAYVKKIGEVGISDVSVEVLKTYEPTSLYAASIGPSSYGGYPQLSPLYPYAYPQPSSYPSAGGYPPASYSYYPQGHAIPAGYGIYPLGYSGQLIPGYLPLQATAWGHQQQYP